MVRRRGIHWLHDAGERPSATFAGTHHCDSLFAARLCRCSACIPPFLDQRLLRGSATITPLPRMTERHGLSSSDMRRSARPGAAFASTHHRDSLFAARLCGLLPTRPPEYVGSDGTLVYSVHIQKATVGIGNDYLFALEGVTERINWLMPGGGRGRRLRARTHRDSLFAARLSGLMPALHITHGRYSGGHY